jgi:hypothetical protein
MSSARGQIGLGLLVSNFREGHDGTKPGISHSLSKFTKAKPKSKTNSIVTLLMRKPARRMMGRELRILLLYACPYSVHIVGAVGVKRPEPEAEHYFS